MVIFIIIIVALTVGFLLGRISYEHNFSLKNLKFWKNWSFKKKQTNSNWYKTADGKKEKIIDNGHSPNCTCVECTDNRLKRMGKY